MKIATCQLRDVQGDPQKSLTVIKNHLIEAELSGVDVVCFPECFLQGYTLDASQTAHRAFSLNSQSFGNVLALLAPCNVTAILGIIEHDNGNYYNTAVVIRRGRLLGKYRKVHLFEPNFQPGTGYPTFSIGDTTVGLNICYDARFSDGATRLSQQGAKVIFYLLNNKLPVEKANKYRTKHLPNLINRAKESGCWVVSSDVIARGQESIGYGHTAIIDPTGAIVAQAAELTETRLILDLGKAKQFRVQ